MAKELMLAASKKNLTPAGLSFHVGSQQVNIKRWVESLKLCFEVYSFLKEITEKFPVREEIIVSICINLIENARKFFNQGFDPFKRIWNASDYYLGSNIVIKSGKLEKIGKSLGVNGKADLIIESDLGQELISNGEIYFDLNEARRSFDGDT